MYRKCSNTDISCLKCGTEVHAEVMFNYIDKDYMLNIKCTCGSIETYCFDSLAEIEELKKKHAEVIEKNKVSERVNQLFLPDFIKIARWLKIDPIYLRNNKKDGFHYWKAAYYSVGLPDNLGLNTGWELVDADLNIYKKEDHLF